MWGAGNALPPIANPQAKTPAKLAAEGPKYAYRAAYRYFIQTHFILYVRLLKVRGILRGHHHVEGHEVRGALRKGVDRPPID